MYGNANGANGAKGTIGLIGLIGWAVVVWIASGGGLCADARAATSSAVAADAQIITVATSPPGTRSDDSIIADIRRALRRVPDMDDSAIRIRSQRGVVTLSGTVPESWQISRAANVARRVHGVKSVSNRLTEREKEGGEPASGQ